MSDRSDDGAVRDEHSLRGIMGETMEIAVEKCRPKLDRHCRDFIARSPFLCIGTSGGDGRADVSPRGDHPGFVSVLDDRHLFIPDRPGNNRLDTMVNIVENPEVGLLFLIPGFDDTLRVNGRARISDDPELTEPAAIKGRVPKVGILVEVHEAFLHCAKAFIRSDLWNPEKYQNRKEMPTLARMILEQVAEEGTPPSEAEMADGDAFIAENYKTGLY